MHSKYAPGIIALTIAAIAALALVDPAQAGPNADGVLVVHSSPKTVYSAGQPYCETGSTEGCGTLSTNLPNGSYPEAYVWWVSAVFPSQSDPRVAALTFGVDYDPLDLVLVDYGACAQLEIPDPDWPDPTTGTALGFDETLTEHVTSVYWFSGIEYSGRDLSFRLVQHPGHGTAFADDSVPAVIDFARDLGSLGFGNHPGYLPCPESPGACCFDDGSCTLETVADCAGTWLGASVACDSSPCTVRACCLPDDSCRLLTEEDCAASGGSYEESVLVCEPSPCFAKTGACCFPDQSCQITTASDCLAGDGQYIWDGTVCTPAPCGSMQITVSADGSGDLPTIQAAINAAGAGAVIELADGTYRGHGNRDVTYLGKRITVRSESGDAESCIIDCEEMGRGFLFDSGETRSTVLSDVTVTRGKRTDGGAIRVEFASPTIERCIFSANEATTNGGAIDVRNSSYPAIRNCDFLDNVSGLSGGAIAAGPQIVDSCRFIGNQSAVGGACRVVGPNSRFRDCVFAHNVSTDSGSGLVCLFGTVELARCTFVGNVSTNSQSVIFLDNSHGEIDHTIFASNIGSRSVVCHISSVDVRCSDIFGNDGGDWVGCLAGFNGIAGNFSADPLFCDPEIGDVHLRPGSPCLPRTWASPKSCGLIGAAGAGCEESIPDTRAELTHGVELSALPTLQFGFPHPNPASNQVSFEFELPQDTDVRIRVFDAQGRSVAVLFAETLPAGRHSSVWNLAAEDGSQVAAGVYYLRFSTDGFEESRKVVIAR